MRVLLITYYWPPAGGVAVQRWMKFASLLHSRPDMDLVVYAPENPDYPETDLDLLKDVQQIPTLKHRIFEPYALFRFLTGKSKKYKVKQEFAASSGKSFADKLAIRIRGNFFIPDARKFWIRPSVRYLSRKWVSDGPFDCVISNGTPHSVHLIALELKKRFAFRWIADFRDPWTKVDYFDKLLLSDAAKRKHVALEKAVLTTADHVITVSPAWARDFEQLGARKVSVVTNGFDPNDFPDTPAHLDEHFSVSHIGNFNKNRNNSNIWKSMVRLCNDEPGFKSDLRIRLMGMVDEVVNEELRKYGLEEMVERSGVVSHQEAVAAMQKSRLLLLPVGDHRFSEGRIPAKVFEYMAAKRPILAITPQHSDVREIIEQTQAGTCVTAGDEEGMYNAIRAEYHRYLRNEPFISGADLVKYTRQHLADRMAAILQGSE